MIKMIEYMIKINDENDKNMTIINQKNKDNSDLNNNSDFHERTIIKRMMLQLIINQNRDEETR
jgi:hypothetical protein